jgi:hypothetical protein
MEDLPITKFSPIIKCGTSVTLYPPLESCYSMVLGNSHADVVVVRLDVRDCGLPQPDIGFDWKSELGALSPLTPLDLGLGKRHPDPEASPAAGVGGGIGGGKSKEGDVVGNGVAEGLTGGIGGGGGTSPPVSRPEAAANVNQETLQDKGSMGGDMVKRSAVDGGPANPGTVGGGGGIAPLGRAISTVKNGVHPDEYAGEGGTKVNNAKLLRRGEGDIDGGGTSVEGQHSGVGSGLDAESRSVRRAAVSVSNKAEPGARLEYWGVGNGIVAKTVETSWRDPNGDPAPESRSNTQFLTWRGGVIDGNGKMKRSGISVSNQRQQESEVGAEDSLSSGEAIFADWEW